MRRKFLLGTALALVLLGLFLYNTDFGKMRDAFVQARGAPLLLACVMQASTFFFRAFRWRLLLGQRGRHVPYSSLFNIAAIGFMLNNFVPRGAGELARAYLLGRGHRTGMSATFATIVLERIFDFLTVLVVLAILLAFFELPVTTGSLSGERLRFVGWLVSGATLGIVVVLAVLRVRSEAVLALFRRLLGRFPSALGAKAIGLLSTFIEGLSSLTNLGTVGLIVLHSALLWLTLFVTFPMILGAFDLHLPIQASMLVLVLSVFSMFVPSPGGVGAMHFAVASGLSLYGVPLPQAQAAAIALHASGYLPVTILGLICLKLEGLNLGQLGKAEEAAEIAVHSPEPPA